MANKSTSDHQDAHREGMERARAVSRYLEALYEHRPKRGRKRTPDSIKAKMAQIETQLPRSTGLARLRMMQEQKNLQRALLEMEKAREVDFKTLENDFVKHAKVFADREGIEYSTWIACGVPRSVLARANILPVAGRPPGSSSHASNGGVPAGGGKPRP